MFYALKTFKYQCFDRTLNLGSHSDTFGWGGGGGGGVITWGWRGRKVHEKKSGCQFSSGWYGI